MQQTSPARPIYDGKVFPMTEDHDHHDYCVLCDGTPEEQRAAAAIVMERVGPVIDAIEAQRDVGAVVIPAGLTREQRREFLAANPIGMLVLDQLSVAEIDDWVAVGEDRPGRHASICVTGLSDRNFQLVMFGRETGDDDDDGYRPR